MKISIKKYISLLLCGVLLTLQHSYAMDRDSLLGNGTSQRTGHYNPLSIGSSGNTDDPVTKAIPWYKNKRVWMGVGVVTAGISLVAGVTYAITKKTYEKTECTSVLDPTYQNMCDMYFSGTAYKSYKVYHSGELLIKLANDFKNITCSFACGDWDSTTRADMACCEGISMSIGYSVNMLGRAWDSLASNLGGLPNSTFLTASLPSCTS